MPVPELYRSLERAAAAMAQVFAGEDALFQNVVPCMDHWRTTMERLAAMADKDAALLQAAVAASDRRLTARVWFASSVLPNPHWNPELRPFSGQDDNVRAYVLERDVTERFLDRLYSLLDELLPAYAEEGKSYFTIAFGCTGGRHRSVAVAETVAGRLKSEDRVPRVFHRDIDR